MTSQVLRPGSVIAGRYHVVAPLGSGASAHVYLANDAKLKRQVAVKVLHDHLLGDRQFLKRFSAEAHSVASLNHPNVMHVYDSGDVDVGSGQPAPFLVMEFVGGGSLRSVLDSGPLLTPSQALMVGLEAARGLAYAHGEGFVHRDIKPANLLFGPEGRLRIADFGLARALAEAAWTEPQGLLMGTAKYTAPEQAHGEAVDGKSDVYALALVLVEAVTGSVPFARDTVPATLMARCEADLEVPRSLGRLVTVLEAAGRRDRETRPDAAAFVIACLAASEDMDRPAALRLPGAIPVEVLDRFLDEAAARESAGLVPSAPIDPTDITLIAAPDQTEMVALPMVATRSGAAGGGGPTGSSAVADAPEGSASGSNGGVTDESESAPSLAPFLVAGRTSGADIGSAPPDLSPSATFDRGAAAEAAAGDGSTDDDVDAGAHRRGRRRWLGAVIVALVVAALLGGGAYWWFVVRTPSHRLPDVVGLTADEATSTLEDLGYRIKRSLVRVDGSTRDEVVEQRPKKGTDLAENRTVELSISLGNTLVDMPVLDATMNLDAVKAALAAARLNVGAVTEVFDENVPDDVLISATPVAGVEAANRVESGTDVDLVVSKGPEPRTVPSGLVGQGLSFVRQALGEVQLEANVTEEFSDTVEAGIVMASNQAAGAQVPRGTRLELTVSKGPAPIPIPDVRGKSGSDATTALIAAGFQVSGIEGSPTNEVLQTDPPVGEAHVRNTEVRIFTRG